MAFVVEDGTGLPDANSYVDVAYADTYLADDFYPGNWPTLDNGQKQSILVDASRTLDSIVAWRGVKTVDDSGLRWPRRGVADRDGIRIGDNVIPKQLKEATIEMALSIMALDMSVDQDPNTSYLKRVKADDIEIEWKSDSEIPYQSQVPRKVKNLLAGLIYSTGPIRMGIVIPT